MAQRRRISRSRRAEPSSTKRPHGQSWLSATAHPLCEHCVAVGRVTPVQDVGHAIPLERDGGHDKANVRPCHSAKTAREDVWWRKAPRVYF